MSNSQPLPFFQYHHRRQGGNAEQSPTISARKMIKELPSCSRVQTLDFLSAPKRKRADSIDEISASRREGDDDHDDDDDFVYPLHKRVSSNHRLPSFCVSSCDSERRDGPADDNVLDDETEALVKNFRTSVFRHEPLVSPLSASAFYKPDDDDEQDDQEEEDDDFPTIGRATTISDYDSSSEGCYADPPDMEGDAQSRPASPRAEEIERSEEHHHRDWSSSYLSSPDYQGHGGEEEKDPIEQARARPEWLSGISLPSSSASTASSSGLQPNLLWNTSSKQDSPFWPASGWTGMFHQGSA